MEEIAKRIQDAYSYLHIEDKNKSLNKLTEISQRQDFWDNPEEAQDVVKRMQTIKLVLSKYDEAKRLFDDLGEAIELSKEDESFMEESESINSKLIKLLDELEEESWFSGEFDDQDAILSINPGSGGKEAQDWTDMLYKMYVRFCESQNWKVKTLEKIPGDGIGLDKATIQVSGHNAYGMLSSENGVHRLVRISPTDEKKRRHTTFAAVEVIPLVPNDINIDIKDSDIRVDVYRSSGPGGQSVNTTDSAVRLTHLPSGIVVTCQNEKSQIQNKEAALKVLKAKLFDLEQKKREDEVSALTGAKNDNSFGSQIRNYVLYPYQLIKDLRSDYESGNVDAVLNGDIYDFIISYHKWKALEYKNAIIK